MENILNLVGRMSDFYMHMIYEYLKDIKQIEKGEKVFVWGNGKNGKHICDLLNKANVEVLGVIVSQKDIDDNMSYLLEEIDCELLACANIIITPLYFIRQITNQLCKYNCKKIYINLLTTMNNRYRLSGKSVEEIYRYANFFENGKEEWYSIMDLITLRDFSRVINYDNFRLERQYLEYDLLKRNGKVIDGGAYYFDELDNFVRIVGSKGCVYAFDPQFKTNEENSTLKKYKCALGARSGYMKFAHLDGMSSSLLLDDSSQSYEVIEVTSIDDFCKKHQLKPDFIKLDVEGFEKEVLIGGIRTISSCRPNMAIGIYHSFEEFFEIIDYIKSLELGYRFSFAGYSNTYSESILYAYT